MCLEIRVAKGNLTLRILYFGPMTLSRMINTKHMLGLSESPVVMVPIPGPLHKVPGEPAGDETLRVRKTHWVGSRWTFHRRTSRSNRKSDLIPIPPSNRAI